MNPYPIAPGSGRYLSFGEREEIAIGLAAGRSQAQIARDLGRDPATISREIARNSPAPGVPGPKPARWRTGPGWRSPGPTSEPADPSR